MEQNLATMTEKQLADFCSNRQGIAEVIVAMCDTLNRLSGDLYTSTTEMTDTLAGRAAPAPDGAVWVKLQQDLRILGHVLRDTERIFNGVERAAYRLNRREGRT